MRIIAGCCVILIGLSASLAFAADPNDLRLQEAVSQAADKFEILFAARDSSGLAKLFTEDAEYVNADGEVFHGRKVIEAEYAANFQQSSPGKLSISISSIRPIAEGVIVEEGVSIFTPENDGPLEQTRYTATHVRQTDNTWQLASVRELSVEAQSPQEYLKQLSWLVGKWHEEVDGTLISTEWKWSPDKNFLVSEFSVQQTRGFKWQGTHRITWDAERKQFRSWIFESSGGFGEAWWSSDEESWTANVSIVNAQGVRSASILTYTPQGKDAIVLTSTHSTRGGIPAPDSEHRIVRQPPSPTDATTANSKR